MSRVTITQRHRGHAEAMGATTHHWSWARRRIWVPASFCALLGFAPHQLQSAALDDQLVLQFGGCLLCIWPLHKGDECAAACLYLPHARDLAIWRKCSADVLFGQFWLHASCINDCAGTLPIMFIHTQQELQNLWRVRLTESGNLCGPYDTGAPPSVRIVSTPVPLFRTLLSDVRLMLERACLREIRKSRDPQREQTCSENGFTQPWNCGENGMDWGYTSPP